MRVFTIDDPILHATSTEVDTRDQTEIDRVVSIARAAAEVMYDTDGCGIAAPQVGVTDRFCVIDVGYHDEGASRNPIIMLNPVIKGTSDETEEDMEGCLSVPGLAIAIERPVSVECEYTDRTGERVEISADGLLARCIQHEMDHLDGITMIDRLTGMKRMRALASYKAAQMQGARPGGKAIYSIE